MQSCDRTPDRLDSLESVRGVAALAVLLFHVWIAFWPEQGLDAPVRVLWNGRFAVRVFFVLSGVVLSISYFRRPDPLRVGAAAAARYFRLTPPILASCLFAYLLMATGQMRDRAFADATSGGTREWIRMYDFTPDLFDAMKQGVYRVYFKVGLYKTYNTVLWTMHIELFGSLFVFALLGLCGGLPRRGAVYALLAVVMWLNYRQYLDFLAGVVLCDLWVRVGERCRLGPGVGVIVLLIGLGLGTQAAEWEPEPGPWDRFTAGAVLVIAAVLFTPAIRRVLDRAPLVWLGRISFGLYLVHMPLMTSLGYGTWLALTGLGWGKTPVALATSGAVILATFACAWVFTRACDRPAIVLSRAIARLLLRNRTTEAGAREPARPVVTPEPAEMVGR